MDFELSKEDREFRDEFRAWLEANLPEEERMATVEYGFEDPDDSWEARVKFSRKMARGNWIAISWPKEYGGREATISQELIFGEELERVRAPQLVTGGGTGLVGSTLMRWGTEAQKKRFLARIRNAEDIWCQGFSEPNAGSDLASLQTRAVEEGDHFVVNGQKVWSSHAQHADWCILLVRTDPNAPKHRGISFLLVDMKTPGITVRPLLQITRNSDFNEVFFEDVKVPKENLVGEKNQGWQVAIGTLGAERSFVGTHRDLGNNVRDLAKIAQTIKRNGHTAWEDASVRQTLGELATQAAALKLFRMRLLTMFNRKTAKGPEGSLQKLYATNLYLRISQFALDLMGPYGQLDRDAEFAIDEGRWLVRELGARGLCIGAGSNEIQHNIIGERLLGLPKGN